MPGSSPAGGPPSGGRPGCAGVRSRTPPAGWSATGSSSRAASTGSTITCVPSRRSAMADPPIGREFTITRVFDAPRDLVWKAWTDPEHVARWFGPRGFSTPLSTVTMDVRPGGTFEFTMVSDDDGNEIPSGGTFLEVVEPERLVWRGRGLDALGAVALAEPRGRHRLSGPAVRRCRWG